MINTGPAMLATPANDAGLVADALGAAGFAVTGARNLDQAALRETFREFIGQVAAAEPNAVAVIYLAGFGLQFGGENYFRTDRRRYSTRRRRATVTLQQQPPQTTNAPGAPGGRAPSWGSERIRHPRRPVGLGAVKRSHQAAAASSASAFGRHLQWTDRHFAQRTVKCSGQARLPATASKRSVTGDDKATATAAASIQRRLTPNPQIIRPAVVRPTKPRPRMPANSGRSARVFAATLAGRRWRH